MFKKINSLKRNIKTIIGSEIRDDYSKKNPWIFPWTISYNGFLFILIFLSLLTLLVPSQYLKKEYLTIYSIFEIMIFVILLIDYCLNFYVADLHLKKGKYSFLFFPFSFKGLLLFASLLPSLYLINIWTNEDLALLNYFKALRILRLFRITTILNLLPGILFFRNVLKKIRYSLYLIWTVTIVTLIFCSISFYSFEKDVNPKIKNFFDAIYFSLITLTTIGYGDMIAYTVNGKIIVMVMSFLAVTIVAVPSGIVGAAFIDEWKLIRKQKAMLKEKKLTFKKTSKHHQKDN